MLRMVAPFALIVVLLAVGHGCGPVTSTMTINEAEIAIETARLEQAEEYATYEYVSAVEYFAKAQEEWGYSDYQHAQEYAQRALDFARAALQRTLEDSERGTPTRGFEELDDDY